MNNPLAVGGDPQIPAEVLADTRPPPSSERGGVGTARQNNGSTEVARKGTGARFAA